MHSLYVFTAIRNFQTDQVTVARYKLSQRFGARSRPFLKEESQVESSKEIIYLMQLEVLPFLPAIVMKVFVSTYSICRTLDC